MTSIIRGPKGSQSTDILNKDVLYLKTNVLSFFDSKVYNLYVFVKQREEECFHLFIYKDALEMQLAYNQLSAALEDLSDEENVIRITPNLAAEGVV